MAWSERGEALEQLRELQASLPVDKRLLAEWCRALGAATDGDAEVALQKIAIDLAKKDERIAQLESECARLGARVTEAERVRAESLACARGLPLDPPELWVGRLNTALLGRGLEPVTLPS